MADAIYAKPSDEIGHLATVTLTTGTADADYPVTNVQRRNPIDVLLTTDASGADIVFDHGSAVDVQGFSLHHHNVPATTVINIQRNASNSWGGPTINVAHTVAVYPNPGLPPPIAVDLRAVSGYGSTMRYSRLHIPSPGGSILTGVGAVCWWATLRADLTNVRYPVLDGEAHPQRLFATAYGKKRRYRMGVRLRSQPSTFFFRTESVYQTFLALRRSCADGVNAFLWWRDPSTSDGMLMEFAEDDLTRELNPRPSVTVLLEEIGCGPGIPTSA